MTPEKTLQGIAREIRGEYRALGDLLLGGLPRAVNIGKLLVKAKAIVPHGKWIPWVEKNCPFGRNQAFKYKHLAESNVSFSGHLSINEALKLLSSPDPSVHNSSESPEWYTPSGIIERAVAVLGPIDLDPCSNSGEPNVPSAGRYTAEQDGLAQRWCGTVYMNPPYGRPIDLWIEKLCAEYAAGQVKEAIALVPARTDTAWFHRLRDCAVCFIGGRLKFSGHVNSAPFPSAVIYFGDDTPKFTRAYGDIGDIWMRWKG